MNKEETLVKRPRGVKYELTIRYDGNFGMSESKAWLKKKEKGWDCWVELLEEGAKKLTPGHKYLVGESLKEVIANIEHGGSYNDKKVIRVVGLHHSKCR